MSATILDGRALAESLKVELTEEVADFIENNSVVPCLAAILVGADPASEVYVRNKRKACDRVGLESQLHRLDENVSMEELLDLIRKLNKDEAVHGILVQLPLPGRLSAKRVLQAIHPTKDVDGFHPENVGRMVQGNPRFLPCTPLGVQQLLLRNGVQISGRHVVIVGRSEIVGKPLANMFLQKGVGGDATVTICHSRTADLAKYTQQADILVAAIGRPKFITADMVKPGAVVVDVGINRVDEGLVGDVDFAGVSQVASKITPVPGGVGPLTIAMLMHNTLQAARLQESGPE